MFLIFMKVPYFIASKIVHQKQQNFSALITKVATIATALSLAVMIVATAMVNGFQKVIEQKAYNLWGHIQITEYSDNRSYENSPIHLSLQKLNEIKALSHVKLVQPFATKPGIIKKNEQIEGVVLKGIDGSFNNDFFKQYIPNYITSVNDLLQLNDSLASNKIIISQKIAARLNLKKGDECMVYFIDKSPRVRKLQVSGIYHTGLIEFDKVYSFVDIRLVQKLNNWQQNEVGGYEIFVEPVSKMDTICTTINKDILPLSMGSQTIHQLFATLFDWLNLQNTTEILILVLMLIVALINVVSSLLILILERTQMIGILKTMGMKASSLRQIFIIQASFILMKGVLWGNAIGLSICAIQHFFKLIKLNEETYYISEVAVDFNIWIIAFINLSFIVVSILSLLLPAIIINYIKPIKAIKFQ
jgi:lipoprotein-releasing system permease protein